jgi:hypothetical protein
VRDQSSHYMAPALKSADLEFLTKEGEIKQILAIRFFLAAEGCPLVRWCGCRSE